MNPNINYIPYPQGVRNAIYRDDREYSLCKRIQGDNVPDMVRHGKLISVSLRDKYVYIIIIQLIYQYVNLFLLNKKILHKSAAS